ncbi:Imm50 family immunity protein [Streptomyces roseoverticillatus]|uniref:Imm50 family immunity protein n=1 Tax=Streptomyces roseoverticillatus TaxID=66429 RepID=UPI0012FF4951|nr:Imm50 family immunity protein [Streptomyces roseoverticillatus]
MWAELLTNPAGITSIYGGSLPPLQGVHIHEVSLNREGPTLKVRFDLSEYPERAPRKWVSQGFNTVQIELCLSGVRDVALTGFGTDPIADIILTRTNSIEMELVSAQARIKATADSVFISNISAYLDDREGGS